MDDACIGTGIFAPLNEAGVQSKHTVIHQNQGYQGYNANYYQPMNVQNNHYPYSQNVQQELILQNILNTNLQLMEFNNKLVSKLNELEKKLDLLTEKIPKDFNSNHTNLNLNLNKSGESKITQVTPTLTLTTQNSLIFKEDEQFVLNQWLGFEPKYELLYRSSEHGKGTLAFHRQCDNKGPTITFIETTDGHRFGGYTNIAWNCSGNSPCKNKATFMFSLDKPTILQYSQGTVEILCNASNGPSFGSTDLTVKDDGKIFSSLYVYKGNYEAYYLTGNYENQAKLIEVFSITPK